MEQGKSIQTEDERGMRAALDEAYLAKEAGEVPIGAVVVYRGRIVGRGRNHVEQLQDPTAHAEILAITAATEDLGAKYLTDCTLYVTLEPCVMCMGALRWAQVSRIVYAASNDAGSLVDRALAAASDPKAGFHVLAPKAPHPRAIIEQGPFGEEAADLLRSFFSERR